MGHLFDLKYCLRFTTEVLKIAAFLLKTPYCSDPMQCRKSEEIAGSSFQHCMEG